MMIKTIVVKNFRGLRNLKCDSLGAVTLIGGRNNCGKTSFLEAVEVLSAGALGSIAFRLNRSRMLYSTEWGHLASVFSDCDTEKAITVSGTFVDGGNREVNLRIVPRDLSIYSDSERQEQRLAKRFQVTSKDHVGGKEVKEESSFFWETKRLSKGQMERDSWVATNENANSIRFVYLSSRMEVEDFTHSLASMIDAKSQGQIVETLRAVDPRIQNLVVNDRVIKADIRGVSSLLPVQLLGDGMGKIIAILMAVERCADGGCVCIDEIDTGLHYSTYLTMMQVVVDFAHRHNVQLFVTTHNKEFLQRLSETETMARLLSPTNCFSYINLVRYDDDSVEALHYDYSQFCDAVETGVEIR